MTRKIIYFSASIIGICLLTVMHQGCLSPHKDQEQDITKKNFTFSFPDSLIAYQTFKEEKLVNTDDLKSKTLRIVTYVDVSCPSCLSNIKNWKNVEERLKPYDVPIIIICQSEDRFETFKFLCEQKKIPELNSPFYLDVKKSLFKRNSFFSNVPNHHTALIGQDNKVLVIGDFTFSKSIEDAYIELLNTHQIKP